MLRVGQKIVCIDADGAPMLELGAVYTIKAIDPCQERRWRGKIYMTASIHLWETKPEPQFWGFNPVRFRPAVDRPTDISIFKKMLKSYKSKADA